MYSNVQPLIHMLQVILSDPFDLNNVNDHITKSSVS